MIDAEEKQKNRPLSAKRISFASEEFKRFGRFGIAGIANTMVGFGIIAALDIGMRVRPMFANAVGYTVGIAFSFILNRHFVFRSRRSVKTSGPRFLISALIAFAANLVVLGYSGHLLGNAVPSRLAAQTLGMVSYTVILFMLGRFWAFNE